MIKSRADQRTLQYLHGMKKGMIDTQAVDAYIEFTEPELEYYDVERFRDQASERL